MSLDDEDRNQALERLNDSLEKAIAARTRELAEANAALRLEMEERARTQEAHRRAEIQYRSLARSVPNAAMLLFDHDLRFLVAEGADLLAYSGFDKTNIAGKTLWEVGAPENFAVVEPVYRAALRGETSTIEVQRRGRDFSVYTGPVYDDLGTITGGLIFFSDITTVKRAERLLQENEERFRNLAEATFEGIALVDGQIIVDVNGALVSMFGRSPENLVGTTFAQLMHPLDAEAAAAHLDAGGTESRESTGVRPDGTTFPLEVRARMAALGGRTLLAVAVRDLSDRRRAEEALGRSERQFHQLVESIPDGVVVVRDGRYVYLNPAALAIHGYDSVEQLFGRSILITIHPDDRAGVAESLAKGQGAANPHQLRQTRALRGDGTTIMLESISFAMELDGLPSIVAVIRDITARRKAEIEAQEATQLWRAILDGSDHSIIATTPGGTIREFNPAAERMLGYAAEEVIGQVTPALIHDPAEVKERARELSLELETEIEPGFETFAARSRRGLKDERDWTYIRKDGSRFPVRLSVTALRDTAGTIQGFLGIGSDITDKKRVEADLLRAKEAAEQAMRTRADFLARMSHEIRTPMNGVIGMTDLALQTTLTAEQRDYLETVRKSAGGLLSLINDILDFSKMDAGKLHLEEIPFRPREVLGVGLRALSSQAVAKGLELVVQISPDVPQSLLGDPHRLQQVMTNLVGNAVKFTEVGEVSVRVAVGGRTVDEVTLEVEVSDTGIGIAVDKQALILEAFSQADEATTRRYGGTGLGLAICRQLIELMGGHLSVDSVLGRGSRFTFTATFLLDPQGGATLQSEPLPRGMRALVIDDHRGQRAAIARILESWHLRVATAAGFDAIEQARIADRRDDAFSLIVLDADLPGIDRHDLAAALRTHIADETPLILMSATGTEGDRQRDPTLGPHAYVAKPIAASALLETIQALLVGRVAVPVVAPPREGAAVVNRAWNVLVAEDNAVNRKVVTRFLERIGCRVVAVDDGKQAVAAVAAQHFDFVLMDVQMPVMDGLEATRTLRLAEAPGRRRLPVIALTAQAMMGDRERCLAAGMDGYVTKPITREALLSGIEEVLARLQTPPALRPDEATGSGGHPSFDRTELLARVEGDQGLLVELIGLFLSETPALLQKLEAAVHGGDARAVASAAHILNGALLNLSARRASSLARALEEYGRGNQLAEAGAALARLRDALADLEVEFRKVAA